MFWVSLVFPRSEWNEEGQEHGEVDGLPEQKPNEGVTVHRCPLSFQNLYGI
ncbi:hypothetical protein AM1_E0145 (plasmid) [Acaryochloris marina MBIC11017]|uniref:Uncharacterized protein n=1 Tax=Acaryochloris marina (strain MBIC 11017) TaxID=329726 RepID=A8ZPH8_ACAM1|nr:hypothetical protein AM1_E0145 [Acaryochloris marina MBIC11017]